MFALHRQNLFLTAKTKAERKALAEGLDHDTMIKAWAGGRICGQCTYYRPLGGCSALNGTCMKSCRTGYTKPADSACMAFSKVEGGE
jgi:hypothetical protein